MYKNSSLNEMSSKLKSVARTLRQDKNIGNVVLSPKYGHVRFTKDPKLSKLDEKLAIDYELYVNGDYFVLHDRDDTSIVKQWHKDEFTVRKFLAKVYSEQYIKTYYHGK